MESPHMVNLDEVRESLNQPVQEVEETPPPEKPPEEDKIEEEVVEQEESTPETEEQEPDYKETITKLQERIEKQEKLLAKTGTELGLLRKKSPEEEKERLQEIRDLYLEDPIAAQDELLKFRKEQEEAEKEKFNAMIEHNKSVVEENAPDFKDNISEIVEVLGEDGYDNSVIEGFKSNPYNTPSDLLFMLNKRVSLRKENAGLKSRVTELETKIAELEKKPDDLLERVERATTRKITAKTGGAEAKEHAPKLTNAPHRLSLDEARRLATGG